MTQLPPPLPRPPAPVWAGIWLVVLPITALLAAAWVGFKLPTPACPFHTFTTLPCPSCGMTRGTTALLHGQWQTALSLNPLVFILPLGLAGFWLYCLALRLGILPPPRPADWSPRLRSSLRLAIVLGLAAFWIFLIFWQS